VIDDPEQQLRESLELLCHAYAAASGHLYLMREEGLVHAAAHAAEPPSEFLGNAVAEFWIRLRAHADLSTAVLLPAGSHVTIDRVWTDPLGISLLPVLLHCAIAGVHRHVGVLVVMADPSAMLTTNAPEIATAVATHLVRSGAATGSVV
jgi:GAF domain-containing protein